MRHRLVAALVLVFAAGILPGPPPAAAEPRVYTRPDTDRRDMRDRRDLHDRRDARDRRPPRHHHVVVPRAYYVPVYPSYVAPAPVWVPGYWTWRWVPQVQTTYAYVPGYYDTFGLWVASRYEPQSVEGGYYQQVWVDGYWR